MSKKHFGIGQWKPGKTAPEDGSAVLVMCRDKLLTGTEEGIAIVSARFNIRNRCWYTAPIEPPGPGVSGWPISLEVLQWAEIKRTE